MSTESAPLSQDISTPVAPLSVRSAAWGFFWGGCMLGIFCWWLSYRNLEVSAPFVYGTGVLGVLGIAMFLWYLAAFLQNRRHPERLHAAETHMRPVDSLAMFVGAGVLIGLAVWLFLKERMSVFAESSSLLVMGLIALGAGLSLRLSWSGPAARQHILETMLGMRKQIAVVLMILGGAMIVGGGSYALAKTWRELGGRFPEGGGLFLIGLIFFSAGLWTQLTLDRPATTYTMRMLLLYVGGLTGFLLALMTALRVLLWWNRYFAAGIKVWQGDEGWHFWACAYVSLIGLGLLFASLLLAQVDIRSSAPMRRLLYGYNAVLTGLLLFAVLVVTVILVFVALPSNVLWSKTMGLRSLSPSSVKMLEELKEPVKVYVLMTRYSGVYLEVRDLLDNCQQVTNKIEVEYLSPDLDSERYRKLAETYPELRNRQTLGSMKGEGSGRGLLLVYGSGPDDAKLPHAFIPDKDLAEETRDPQTREVTSIRFNGEVALMQQIQLLTDKGVKPTVYFTQFKGEPLLIDDRSEVDRNDDRLATLAGLGRLADKLRKDNYVVRGLHWGVRPKEIPENLPFSYSQEKSTKDRHEVPQDCKVLVIVNPVEPFSKEALEAIDRYMDDRKGKLIVMTRLGVYPGGEVAKDGMEEFCKKYGVQLGNDYILSFPPDRTLLSVKAQVSADTNNKVAREFAGKQIRMILPRTVQPIKSPSPYQAETILEVKSPPNGEYSWAETQPQYYGEPLKYMSILEKQGKLSSMGGKQPLSVGVAVTDRDGKPRAIILGDYWPVCNAGISSTYSAPVNYDFDRSCIEWLGDRPLPKIGTQPTDAGIYVPAERDTISIARMHLLPMSLTSLLIIGMGVGVWIVRRK